MAKGTPSTTEGFRPAPGGRLITPTTRNMTPSTKGTFINPTGKFLAVANAGNIGADPNAAKNDKNT